MKVFNVNQIASEKFEDIVKDLPHVENLFQFLNWTKNQDKAAFIPQIVGEVIAQDEFTNDVIIPYKDVFLVFDTT